MLKHSFVVLLLFSMVAHSWAAGEPVQISLDGDWDFTFTGTSTSKIPDLPSASAFDTTIRVPGRWDDQLERLKHAKWWPQAVFRASIGPVQFLSGIGWHRKVIDAPADWANRAAVLTIGNAVGTTHVWLNGEHLGAYDYGVYTPYEVDLTNRLKAGERNELIVAVDNGKPTTIGGWAFFGNAGMASGLARPVTLHVAAGPGHIDDVYIRPGTNLKEVVWTAELSSPGVADETPRSKLQWIVRDAKSNRELGRGEVDVPSFAKHHEVTWKNQFADIKPWSDREPNLYRTELRWVTNDAQLWDETDQRFGLRRWSYEGRKLFLNGEACYLRQEFGCNYFARDGAVATTKDYWVEHMKRLKQLGFNSLNFAAQVCPIEMMEVADELGVILQCGDHATVRADVHPQYRAVWAPIVRTTRRYPSISIYGFGGELNYYEGVIDNYQAQTDLIKSLHPESLVLPQQAIRGIDYYLEDPSAPGVKQEPFVHHAERLARYARACDLFGHYSCGAFGYTYLLIPWREMEARFEIYNKPIIAHELFMGASYLRPTNGAKYTGRIPPYIYTRLEKDLQEVGLIEKWQTYFDHTSRLQHICRKYCMEKVRKCDGLAGFELLGVMDSHFLTPEYAVGMVDEFLEMKPGDTVEGIRRYSNESVLLLDFDNGHSLNRCYWAGEPFEADVMVSLFGRAKLAKGVLEWKLSDGDKIVVDNSVELSNVSHGGVTTLKKLQLNWPKVKHTTRLKLSAKLTGSGYDLANDWDFWVFPKLAPPEIRAVADDNALVKLQQRYADIHADSPKTKEKLRIVSSMTENDFRHFEQGGDVLLLGTEPFTAYTKWPYFVPGLGGRPHGNVGAVIAKHPIFAGHPNEGWNDWLFLPLMEGANCVLFDGAIDMAFDPILEIVSSAGHVRKQAAIFENRVGEGRLLVATTLFDMSNPSCVTLMDNILRYIEGDLFDPQHRIEVHQLVSALSPENSDNKLADPGFEKSGYWVSEGGRLQMDEEHVRSGRKSLKFTVTPEDLRESQNFASSIAARRITWDRVPHAVKLSAWLKSDMTESGSGLRVRANLFDLDGTLISHTISPTVSTSDWHYVEKTIDLSDKFAWADIYVELVGTAGTAWVDDVFFGETSNASEGSGESTDNRPQTSSKDELWTNKAYERELDPKMYYRIGEGEWQHHDRLRIDREGKHQILIKKSEDDNAPVVEKVNLDLTPPVVALEIDPFPQQAAGEFTVTSDAEFSVSAKDALSGVKTIEVAINGEDYLPYKASFKLPVGRHVIRCRATDVAGNESRGVTGEWTTGNDVESFEVQVVKED